MPTLKSRQPWPIRIEEDPYDDTQDAEGDLDEEFITETMTSGSPSQ